MEPLRRVEMVARMLITLLMLGVGFQAYSAEYIIKYKAGAAVPLSEMNGIKVQDTHAEGRLVKVKIADDLEKQTVKKLQETTGIEYVVKDFRLKAFRKPMSTQALRKQWAIAKVNAEKAW